MLHLICIYDSLDALCSLYAEGVLWARNVRQKAPWTLCALWEKKFPMNKRMRQKRSVKSVSSVRDNTSQWFAWVSSHSEGAYFFSQNNTDEQNTQHFTEPLRAAELTEHYSQQRPHPQPLSEWRGEWLPRYPYVSSRCLAAHLLSSAGQKG